MKFKTDPRTGVQSAWVSGYTIELSTWPSGAVHWRLLSKQTELAKGLALSRSKAIHRALEATHR